jgi:hypothetical protein
MEGKRLKTGLKKCLFSKEIDFKVILYILGINGEKMKKA